MNEPSQPKGGTMLNMLTPQQRARMRQESQIAFCTIGGEVAYGSLNEYEAARLQKGDTVEYHMRSKMGGIPQTGEGIVSHTLIYDGLIVVIEGGVALQADVDLIENVGTGDR